MKLSYDEISSVLTFCDRNTLIKILPRTGELRYHSSCMLSNYESICNSILDKRQQMYKVGKTINDTDIFEEFIDITGMDDAIAFKENIYYDKRLESIFTVNATDGSRFLLSKKIGKIFLEKPYEYFVSISICSLIDRIILPWIIKRYYSFITITNYQYEYINLIFQLVPNTDTKDILVYKKLSLILKYLYTLLNYLENYNRMQLPNKHRKIIRKMSYYIKLELSL